MGGLSQQKRMSAEILKVGESRVWMDNDHLEDIKKAVTRSDIRKMISHGYIKAKREKIKRPKLDLKKRKKGPGSRKGSRGARLTKKRKWINTIRPLRRMLKKLRDEEKIDKEKYRKLYLLVKSGAFRSRSHLKLYLTQRGILHENRSKV
ncbi:MAG: 50S ribosomal protein L19e [Candidatus Aenigmarchaeota archaeon]|nr:50S ribosomal protein L19e [Candidatus Aenigmarchaeota archaeon]